MSNIFDRMILAHEQPSQPHEVSGDEPSLIRASDAEATVDIPRTSIAVKKVTQELLKHGYLEEVEKSELFRHAVTYEREISAALEPLDLEVRLDTHRGVAFLKVAQTASAMPNDDAAWSHPLVRRQRLTLEQSLLVAILRQAFLIHEQETGVGQNAPQIAVEDLLPQFLTYFGDSGSDKKNESRLLNLLDQLKPHGIVSEVSKKHEVTIRPLIAYLADAESLAALLRTLQEQLHESKSTEDEK